MAIRYSGDAEIRMRWEGGRVLGSVRDLMHDGFLWRGEETLRRSPTSEDYDRTASRMLETADRKARGYGLRLSLERDRRGRVTVRRVFQAPCPVGRTFTQRRRTA